MFRFSLHFTLSLISFLSMITPAMAAQSHVGSTVIADAGPGISGGGDECENRIKSIALDLRSWIRAAGSEGLELPTGLSLSAYNEAMLTEINKAKIQCVGLGDKGFPVEIMRTAKTCRFDKSDKTSRITCDYTKIRNLSEEEQYVLVHHEFAGLAGIEPALGDDSRYEISNQISAYLENTMIKKLVVKPSVDQRSLCAEDIRVFVETQYPFDTSTEEQLPLVSVSVDKVEFSDATGFVEIEAHALFDEDGYVATRIFIEAEGVWQNFPGQAPVPKSCEKFRVKASFPNPLAE